MEGLMWRSCLATQATASNTFKPLNSGVYVIYMELAQDSMLALSAVSFHAVTNNLLFKKVLESATVIQKDNSPGSRLTNSKRTSFLLSI